MANVRFTFEINTTLCSELSDMRKMLKTYDFSGLSASIERLQTHGNSMENALQAYNDTFYDFEKVFDENKREEWDGSNKWILDTDEQKLLKLKELFDNRKIRNVDP